MSWLDKNKRLWRGLLLGLLFVALLAPWTYEQISVPAEYPCGAPYVRLEGDYCGEPLSGLWMLLVLAGWSVALFTGRSSLSDTSRGFFLFMALALPLISTAALLLRGDRRGLVVFHLVALTTPLIFFLLLGMFNDPSYPGLLWGPWLYAGAAAAGLALEAARLAWLARQRRT